MNQDNVVFNVRLLSFEKIQTHTQGRSFLIDWSIRLLPQGEM